MNFLTLLLILAVQGLVVGAFGRLALPGRDPMSIPQTIGLGLAGTFLAGIIMWLATGGSAAPSFIVALFFTVVLLYVVRRRRGGSLTDPGRVAGRRGLRR